MKSKTIIQTFVAIFAIAMMSLTTACSFDLKGLFGGGSDGPKVDTPLRVDTVITFAGLPDYLDQQRGKSDLYFAISDPSNSKVASMGGLIRNASQKIHLSFEPSDDFNKVSNEAFANCNNLIEISLPKGVTILGSLSFYDCTKLEKVSLPNSLTNIMDGVFCLDSLLSDVDIPDNVIALGDSSFCYTAIRKVTIPEGVKRIETLTFGECKRLIDVKIPKSVSYIGPASFAITGIENITLTAKTIDEYAFWFCKNLKIVNIENSVDEVGENAFCNAEIDNLNISSKIIGKEAFKFCKIKKLVINNSVKDICKEAFRRTEIDDADISAQSIGSNTFEYCKCNTLVINSPIVGSNAFYSAELGNLSFTNKVDFIYDHAFYGSSLKIVELSASKIGEYAFSSCKQLEEVRLTSNVKEVGISAFGMCDNLRSFYYDGNYDIFKIPILDYQSNKLIVYVNEQNYNTFNNKYSYKYMFRVK